ANDTQSVSGCEFVRRLRRSPNSPNPFIPIIMLADINENSLKEDARDSGVNELAVHPLEAKALFSNMLKVIDKPRIFITADTYRGPCRRLEQKGPPEGTHERRIKDIRIIRYNEAI
ncbi:MAG: hypothetical protein AB7F82_07865, partial [Alphaproteobacteria bacterium]